MTLRFDPNSMKIRDLVDLEDAAGAEAFQQIMEGKPTAKMIAALVWILKRRENPDFTLEDAYEVEVGQVDLEVVEPEAPDGAQ